MDNPDQDALKAMLEASPQSYDLSMLKPLREQLKGAQQAADQAGDVPASDAIDALHEAVQALETEQTRRLDGFAMEVGEDFEKAVKAKRDVELRWIDDCLMYDGDERLRDSKAYPNDAGDENAGANERPAYRAIRSRTLRYAARLTDMLLPGNDIPMKVEATPKPDPECFPALCQLIAQGQQVDPGMVLDMAADAAAKMQETIKDQLGEQRFMDHGRRAIFNGTKLGTGITKGPFMDYRRRRKPKGLQSEIVLDESPTPGCNYVDPWLFYDDMSPTLEECSKCFEVHIMDRRKLMDLKRYPNIIESNIDELLKEKDPEFPKELKVNITTRNERLKEIESIKDRWAVIEMHGVMEVEDVESALGIEWTDTKSLPLVEFWFCNGKAIKFKLSALECDWRVPYYNFTPFPCDDTIWGYGVPRMGRGGGKIIAGALNATMTNAACAMGPFIAFKKGEVTPADGNWVLTGPKVLEVQTDGDIGDAVHSFMVAANVEGNLALLDKGVDLLDDDILLDQIIQGDISDEEVPASGLLQIINLRTIFQRMIAAGADDSWFKPMGDRWAQWNLQFNPDQAIKGDFDVKGIASTTLVSKDLQIQHMQVLMQVSAQPQFSGFTNNYELYSSYVRMMDVPSRDKLIYDKQTAEKNQQQAQANGGDPMVAVKMQELELKKAQLQSDGQLKVQEVQWAHEERMAEIARQTQNDQLQAQMRHEDSQTKLLIERTRMQTAILSLAQESKQQIWQITAAMKKASLDNETKRITAGISESGQNARAGAQIIADTAHKAADIHQGNVHKAVDVRMEREQRQHEKTMPKPQVNNGSANE